MTEKNYAFVSTLDEAKILLDKLWNDDKLIGFDIETGYNGKDRVKGSVKMDWPEQFIVGFSITNSTDWARYVPLKHDFGPNLDPWTIWELFKELLEKKSLAMAHGKFEARNLRLLDVKGDGPAIDVNMDHDVLLQSYALGEGMKVDLKGLVLQELGHQMMSIHSLFSNGLTETKSQKIRFNTLDLTHAVVAYACEDSLWTLAAHNHLYPRVQAERLGIYQIEVAIAKVLVSMEATGVAVDWDALEENAQRYPLFRANMEDSVRVGFGSIAPEGVDVSGINFGSSKQMQKLLYDDLGMKTTRTTGSGAMSTDAQALEGLSHTYPMVKNLLNLREVDNLGKRHKGWLTDERLAFDDRVHASFNQTFVPSGRFSASGPAIQQLPKKWWWQIDPDATKEEVLQHGTNGVDYWAGNFRDYIVAAPGRTLLTYDYSQIELRVLAGLSKEPALIEAFANGTDVHTMTASQMLGIPVEKVTSEQRSRGKTFNFAILYGMGVKSLAERLGITKEEAQQLYDAYMSAFSKITEWKASMERFGKTNGYVTTAFGRKIDLSVLLEPRTDQNSGRQSHAERLCVNGPCQGSAADLMKVAMIRARNVLVERGWWDDQVYLTMNQHDALTFEVDNSLPLPEVQAILNEAVVFNIEGFPQIVADWESGHSWGSSKKWELETLDPASAMSEPEEPPVEVHEEVMEGHVEDMQGHVEDMQGHEEVAQVQLQSEPVPATKLVIELETLSKSSVHNVVGLVQAYPGPNEVVLWANNAEVPLGSTSKSLLELNRALWLFPFKATAKLHPDSVDLDAFADVFA
jgi:DNA polymerase-1